MRPRYETDTDRENQKRGIAAFIGNWPFFAVKLSPPMYSLSFALHENNKTRALAAWVQYKRRHHARGLYPSFMMSKRKWEEGGKLALQSGKPFMIVVEWDDGVFYVRQDEIAGAVSFGDGGRRDRGDPKDIEPCVFIPVSLFRPRDAKAHASARATAGNASSPA